MFESRWFSIGMVIFVVMVVVPLVWCTVMWCIAQLSGWGRLARHYESNRRFEGKRYPWSTGQFGWIGYNGVLTYTVTEHGLGIAVLPIFSAGHPPLLIPWKDLKSLGDRRWFWRDYELYEIGVPVLGKLMLRSGIVRTPDAEVV